MKKHYIIEELTKKLIDITIHPFRRINLLRKVSAYVLEKIVDGRIVIDLKEYNYLKQREYNYLKEVFIRNGKNSKYNESIRREIVKRFERIDIEMSKATTPTDGLFLAEALLSVDCDGAVVECGCYAGASTAKLSIVTQIAGRELFVFDSFEGLPKVAEYNIRDYHARRSSEWVSDWKAGKYAATMEQVKSNVEKYGEISISQFYKGWFADTLKDQNLPKKIAFAFTDVDIANSARDCFLALWPRLSNGGIYFSHDVAYIKVLQAIMNESIWKDTFHTYPPIFFGAGYGMCNSSPHLGFAVKGNQLTAEYIKSLTIEK